MSMGIAMLIAYLPFFIYFVKLAKADMKENDKIILGRSRGK